MLLGSGLVHAQGINEEINYQGKLLDNTGATVADADYEITYRLYNQATGGAALFTEVATSTVTSGLFSYLIGSSTSLSGVDFNQTLWLSIEVNGDGEMSPRKRLGAVPAAFEAKNAQTLAGIATTSFLRSDIDNTATALLSFTGGLISNSSSTITDLHTGTTTVTVLDIGGESYTDISGSGLEFNAGALTANIGESNLNIAGSPTDDYILVASSTAIGGFAWVASTTVGVHDAVSLAGSYDYLTLSNQVLTLNQIDLSTDVTGELADGNLSANVSLLGQTIDLANEVIGTLDIASTSLSVSATGLTYSAGDISLTSGYNIPLTASTTNWNAFYDTPSNRITAGTGLSWSGNTLNAEVQSSDLASFGTDNQIPFTNAGGTDFEYSADFVYNGTDLDLAGINTGLAFQGTRFFYASTTNRSVAIGQSAGANFNPYTGSNVAIGYLAGQNASTTLSDNNIYIGSAAGSNNTSNDNVMIGSGAGSNNRDTLNNFIGFNAGFYNTGSRNNIFGDFTGYNNTGSYNNLIGSSAGDSNSGSYNNFIGFLTGLYNTGNFNDFIGYQTGRYLQSTSTIAIGGQALYGSHATNFIALNNTAIGYRAGYAADDGANNNILIGYQAADSLTTGANNIVIGYDVEAPSNTADYQLNIGNIIFGQNIDGTGTTLSTGNIGIGTSTPTVRLSVYESLGAGQNLVQFNGGDANSLFIENTGSGVYEIVNDGNNNGITIYDNTAGVALNYSGTAVAIADANGLNINSGEFRIGNQLTITSSREVRATEGSATTPGYAFRNDSNTGIFNEGGLDVLGFTTAGTERMRISAAGDIGIGTTSPASKLDVWGDFRVGTSSTPTLLVDVSANKIVIPDGGSTNASLAFNGNTNTGFSYAGGFLNFINNGGAQFSVGSGYLSGSGGSGASYILRDSGNAASPTYTFKNWTDTGIWAPADDSIAFGEGGAETMRISSDGYLGIGTTSPASKLDVWGDFRVGTSSTPTLFTDVSSSYVGIGTDSPARELHVMGTIRHDQGDGDMLEMTTQSTHPTLKFTKGGVTPTFGMYYYGTGLFAMNHSTGGNVITIDSAGSLGIGDWTTEARLEVSANGGTGGNLFLLSSDDDNDGDILTVLESGNVGIGTTSPASKLDVWGDFRVGTSSIPSLFVDASADQVMIGTTTAYGTGGLYIEDESIVFRNSVEPTRYGEVNVNTLGYLNVLGSTVTKVGLSGDSVRENMIYMVSGNVIFNAQSGDVDVITRGDTDAELLFVNAGNDTVGISTSTASQTFAVDGTALITGALYDNSYSAGTNGMVLQTTGTGFAWVATSTLGLGGGSFSDYGANTQIPYMNGTSDFAYSSNLTFDGSVLTASNASTTVLTNTGSIYLGSELVHEGDTDTSLAFGTNQITFYAGSQTSMILSPNYTDTADIQFNYDSYFTADVGVGTSTKADSARLSVQSEGTTDIFNLFETDGAEVFTVLENGNVGIGTSSPSAKLAIVTESTSVPALTLEASGSQVLQRWNDSSGIQRASLTISGSAANFAANTGYFNNISTESNNVTLAIQAKNFTSTLEGLTFLDGGTVSNSTGDFAALSILPTYNQSGSAGATDLLINRTETAVGSGSQYLIDAQVGGVSQFVLTNAGNVGIGTTSPASKLDVWGDFRVGTSSTPSLFVDTSDNFVGIGTTTRNNAVLGIDFDGNSGATYALYNSINNPTLSTNNYAIYNQFNTGVDQEVYLYGVKNNIVSTSTAGNFVFNGLDNSIQVKSGYAKGAYTDIRGTDATRPASLTGYETWLGTSNLDTGYGLYVGNAFASGGTNYGVYVNLTDADVTSGNSIYVGSGSLPSYFGSNVGIGTTSPASKLDVWGDFRVGTSSTPTLLVDVASSQLLIGTTTIQTDAALTIAQTADARGIKLFGYDNEIGNTGEIHMSNLGYLKFDTTSAFLFNDGSDEILRMSSNGVIFNLLGAADNDFRIEGDTDQELFSLDAGLDRVGISSSTPFTTFTVDGDTMLSGRLYDNSYSAGTNGMVLQTTGSGFAWVATSTLGLGGGSFSDYGTDTQIPYMNGTSDFSYSSNFTFDGTDLNLGASSQLGWGGTNYLYASSTNDSVAFGENAGATFNSGTTYNVAIGFEAGRYASTSGADNNVYLGRQAGINNEGVYTNMVGNLAGEYNTGAYNNLFGRYTGRYNSGDENNFLGHYSGSNNTGSHNNFIGRNSGSTNAGDYNNIFGYFAGTSNTGDYNNIFGYQAGQQNNGDFNEFIGYQTANGLQSTSTVAIGAQALYGPGSAYESLNNVAIGYRAGYVSDNGSGNNILIGYQAADSLTTGANNIIIGYDVEAPSNTASNQLNIGNLIFGDGIDGTGTTLSSGGIMIGTTTATNARLSVQSTATEDIFNLFETGGSEVFTVLENGNVGIGTTSPSSKLDVWGGLQVGTGTTPMLEVDTADQTVFVNRAQYASNYTLDLVNIGNKGGAWFSNTNTINNGDNFSTDAVLMTGGNSISDGGSATVSGSILTVDRDDNAVVGTLSVTGSVLEVNDDCTEFSGTCNSSGSVVSIRQKNTGNTGAALNITSATTNNGLIFRANDDDTFTDSTAFVIDQDGNVGAGSSTPSYKLSVAGDTIITGALYDNSNSAGTNGMVLQTTGSGFAWVATSTLGLGGGGSFSDYGADTQIPYMNGTSDFAYSSNFTFDGTDFSVNTNNLFVDGSTGYVGIGTSSPNAKLTIAGDINIDLSNQDAVISVLNTPILRASTTLNNIAFGQGAGESYVSGTGGDANKFNVHIGYQAGQYASSTTFSYNKSNVHIGQQAGQYNAGATNVYIGNQAGQFSTTTASQNVYIGDTAGQYAANSFGGNIMIGGGAGSNNLGYNSIILGSRSGQDATGNLNILLGDQAGRFTTGSGNIFFGASAGWFSDGSYGVAVGTRALQDNDGSGTIGIGYQAGDSATAVGQGIIIGYDVEFPSNTADYQLNIGNIIFGENINGTGTTLSSGNIGIGTTSPASKLDVWGDFRVGTSSIPSLFVDVSANQVLLGTTTTQSNTTLTIAQTADDAGITIAGYDDRFVNTGTVSMSGLGYLVFDTQLSQKFHINGSEVMSIVGGGNPKAVDIGDDTEFRFGSDTDFSIGYNSTANDFRVVAGNTLANSAALAVDTTGYVGIGTSSPTSTLDVWGDFRVGTSSTPALFTDVSTGRVGIGTDSPGATLHVSGGDLLLDNNTYIRFKDAGGNNRTFVRVDTGDNITIGSQNLDNINFDVAGATDALVIKEITGYIGISTTSPSSLFSWENLDVTAAGVFGYNRYASTSNSTNGAAQFAGQGYFELSGNTATSTFVGDMIRIEDGTAFGNTVRGFEVQANKGGNTLGENTALSGFARTFGVRGYSSGDAGDTYEPAGGFFETGGTTQGNAIRGYSSSITTSELLSLFQDTSDFTGTGMLMNFGNSGGSFPATSTAKFVDFQNAGTSKFTVTANGTTTIGDGTTNNQAGLQIGYGGLCVDNDGSCTASTTGRISSVSSYTGNSDLAEMYFSSEELVPGEIVVADGFLSITRAIGEVGKRVLGVVSTKPGLLLGYDDTSLVSGQQGYPLALSGRVPVRLSDENGPIEVGDALTLSSLPGVAMKARATDSIVGYALEAYDGTHAYTEGFVDQFGDDIAEPDYEALNENTDTKAQDGCYYGGGTATGEEATEECVDEEDVIETMEEIAARQEREAQRRYEAEQAALQALRDESAEIVALDSETNVRVGTVIMFVQSGYQFADAHVDILNELTSTSTSLVLGAEEGSNETLWGRMKELAQGFVNGVLTIAGIKTDKVETSELCVDDVCVTADDLRVLLEAANSGTATETPSDTTSVSGSEANTTETGNESASTGGSSSTEETTTELTSEVSESASSTDEIASSTEEVVVETEEGTGNETSTASSDFTNEQTIEEVVIDEVSTEDEVLMGSESAAPEAEIEHVVDEDPAQAESEPVAETLVPEPTPEPVSVAEVAE